MDNSIVIKSPTIIPGVFIHYKDAITEWCSERKIEATLISQQNFLEIDGGTSMFTIWDIPDECHRLEFVRKWR